MALSSSVSTDSILSFPPNLVFVPHSFQTPNFIKLDEDSYLFFLAPTSLATLHGMKLQHFSWNLISSFSVSHNYWWIGWSYQPNLLQLLSTRSTNHGIIACFNDTSYSHTHGRFDFFLWNLEQALNSFCVPHWCKNKEIQGSIMKSQERSFCFYLSYGHKKIIATLAVVGSPISTEDHIDTIFDGLPKEYDGFITYVILRTDH